MADSSTAVSLSPSVEQLLQDICTEQSQFPPDKEARLMLASLGEEASLKILRTIAGAKIRQTFSGFIKYLAKQATSSSPVPSQKIAPSSPCNFASPVKRQKTAPLSPSSFASPVSRKITSFYSSSNQTPASASYSPLILQGREEAAHSSFPEHLTGSSFLTCDKASKQAFSPQLVALGELEFRKAFLILSYTGGKRLEDVISAEEIRGLENLPMERFEFHIWNAMGKNNIEKEERSKAVDWDSGKSYLYHCHVSPQGSYKFKGPYLSKTTTHLHRVLGDHNVLNVKFAEGVTEGSSVANGSSDINSGYNKILKEGILVGLRRYRFFVFKDGGKKEKKKNPTTSPVKCYFVCTESDASSDFNKPYILYKKTIPEARCVFMHVHTVSTVAKYMARFSLILSKTIRLEVDLASVNVERIEDIPCRDDDGHVVYGEDGEPLIHTDGTGFISEDLAQKCPKNLFKGNHLGTAYREFPGNVVLRENLSELEESESHTSEPPLLIQFRLFNKGYAVKGTLLVNRKLPHRTIQIRPSMIKVETDLHLSHLQTVNSLEIVGRSNQPKQTYLSRHLIALLSYGGVPKEYFVGILLNALEDVRDAHSNKRAALRVFLRYGEMDDFTAARMILSGIPVDEPFLQHRLSILKNEERKGLKGGRLPVSECYFLMGTADPTGLLESDQVCIILDNGQISGKVLVYKHPGLHFGDIHVLNATYVKAMSDFVGNAKYAIFFPIKGRRSLADEMANSDLDGDMYFVSRNPQLLEHFKTSEPWTHPCSKKNVVNTSPNELSAEGLEHVLFQRFLTTRFQPSRTMGVASDSWLAFMDRLLILGEDSAEEKDRLKRKMLQLVDIYYDALDAPKTGVKIEVPSELKAKIYPHYMDRENSYKSTSILGDIYDTVESFQMQNLATEDVWTLPCFDAEVPEACLKLWKDHYSNYKHDMCVALQQHTGETKESADEVIKKYKQLLYAAAEFEESPRKMEEILHEVLAIYQITYECAKSRGSVSKCGFAWKVAGSALCKLYTMKQSEKSIVCLPSVLREILS